MTKEELTEFRRLQWDVQDLKKRFEWHNEERKELMQEKKELLKRIRETEKKYDRSPKKKNK